MEIELETIQISSSNPAPPKVRVQSIRVAENAELHGRRAAGEGRSNSSTEGKKSLSFPPSHANSPSHLSLQSERLKQLIYATKQQSKLLSDDPYAALFRDDLALNGNLVSNESSLAASTVEQDAKSFANQQLEHLHRVVNNQRHFLIKLTKLHTETKDNYMKLLEEFESEKRKNEKSDPTSETEKAKLRQLMFEEKNERKKAEDELKKIQSQIETERAKQKQMILFLLGDRKQLLVKYTEERKRSEDLAQILSEEKQRVDTIAEGLEEESKKSLRMEADLEKQAGLFEVERKQLRGSLQTEEKKTKEQELTIIQLKAECEILRKNAASAQSAVAVAAVLDEPSAIISPLMSSVAKVVQPTSTVSSVPVSGPSRFSFGIYCGK